MTLVAGVVRWLGCFLLAASVASCSGADLSAPPPRAARVDPRAPNAPPYDRREWRHWIDADHDCQDTRQEVLIAESEVPVEFADARHCRVRRGRWTCPYTGRVVTDPAELDIDHLVPLENAHSSGGWQWSTDKKRDYANDLDDPEHLVAVVSSANRAKGSKGPAEWLPPNAAFVCDYVRDWQAVKSRWSLPMNPVEQRRVQAIIAACRR